MGKNSGFLLGALIGGSAAAITALLLAPESGKELRARLAKQLDDVLDSTADYNDQVVDKADDLKKLAQAKAIQLTKQSEEITNLLKEKTGVATNELYADLKDQVVDLTNKVKQSVQDLDLSNKLSDVAVSEDVEPKGEDIILDFEALASEDETDDEKDIVVGKIEDLIEQVASEEPVNESQQNDETQTDVLDSEDSELEEK
ncbi:YtxH domain-containing protein [Enterococcus cecorum]|uniref:YtxH domain-containing protein n=1 Tax=Enterococcus cecorum TaxID=44008 RepID=UPI0022D45B5D|nr:YtxH domain-containing protein [Enterococcus cecorum]CAI3251360.1 YtxH domain-containing protein [Enterococcus cecorum]CAI3251908.1 YtxH domain-containing protein [Enterococcus cecorum]CAI3251932.1 YtxH domain-containing protein [Enterococcus cecorum]CAI3252035.1 YtxH domain-containing protein [Enterococcus cecorum]CAI3252174.1 YtxH domain-containing protein [Enterococcus cecorum]